MTLSLRPIENADLELLHQWLNRKHLFPFYMQDPISIEEVFKKFEPRVGGAHSVKCIIASVDATPFGYVQWYLNRSYPDYGAALLGKGFGFSIDYFIGETDFLGKALGSSMLKLLVEQSFPLLGSEDKIAYISHDILNHPAIRCTMNAGFREGEKFSDNGKDCTLYSYVNS